MNEKKKLLAILGSPHEDGSVSAMLKCAADAAREAGWQVDLVNLYGKNISYCKGCRACMDAGCCVQQDDIQEIEILLRTCNAVVLGAPTYWANVPAAVKNMFDRLLGTAMEDTPFFPKPRLSREQKYLLLTACNTPFPFSWLFGQSKGVFRAMDEFFKTSGMKRLGRVAYSGAHGKKQLPASVEKKIRGYWI